MLDWKAVLITAMITSVVGAFFAIQGWMAASLISVDKQLAVVSNNVEMNTKMITPLWEKFIQGGNSANFTRADVQTNGVWNE